MILEKARKNRMGVSSVVGVVIMVSIVTIMAAVAGAFVMGMIQIPEPAPTASLEVEDFNEEELTVLHEGGDTINIQDLRVIIYNLDTDEHNNRIDVSQEELQEKLDKTDWSTGDRITIDLDIEIDTDERVDIRIMHLPSESTLYTQTKVI